MKYFFFTIFTIAAIFFLVALAFSEGARLQILTSFYQFIPKIEIPAATTTTPGDSAWNDIGNIQIPTSTVPDFNILNSSSPPLNASSPPQNSTSSPGFRGPSGPPRIIGPSSPPPNY